MNEILLLLDLLKLELERKDKVVQALSTFGTGATPVVKEAQALREAYERGEIVNLQPLFRTLDSYQDVSERVEELRKQLQAESEETEKLLETQLNKYLREKRM